MLIFDSLPSVDYYINSVRNKLDEMPGNRPSLTSKTASFLAFCISAIIITGSLNWDKFERSSCGKWKAKVLSWLLRNSSRIPWEYLLIASTKVLLEIFKITKCHLVFDDFDRERSKRTTKIHGVHKVRNKKGGGFIPAQNIVLLILVTPIITLPVGVWFYQPDPEQKKWRKEDERLRKKKVRRKFRPKKPDLNPLYPTKKQIAAKLLRKFKYYFSSIEIVSISGDAIYLSSQMKAEVSQIFPKTQFLSQLRRNQRALLGPKQSLRLDEYFGRMRETKKVFKLRGHVEKVIYYASARLFIKAHNKVSHVVAYRYEGESRYRFICGSQLTWRAEDIIRAFAFRWLVEVVIEDLKQFDGWGKDASQYDYEGASRGLCLSLLLDQFLLQHPKQQSLYRAGKPLQTAGTLRNQLQFECLLNSIGKIVECEDPKAKLKEISASVDTLVTFRASSKHMAGREFPDLGPTPSLMKRYANTA